MAGVRGGMVANRAMDPTKLSCAEVAGPKGEGKFRLDPRQYMFTSEADRSRVRVSGGQTCCHRSSLNRWELFLLRGRF
jgi:hypothetical protein